MSKVKMLFAVNRWLGREEPPEYKQYLRVWKEPISEAVEIWDVLHPVKEGVSGIGLNLVNGHFRKYYPKTLTNEQVVRKTAEYADEQSIPYFGVMDDDCYMAPKYLEKYVIPAFDKYRYLGQLGFAAFFTKMKLPQIPYAEEANEKLGLWLCNGRPWSAPGVMFYRTHAVMSTRAYTFGTPLMEDVFAGMELDWRGWNLGLLTKGGYSHGKMFRATKLTAKEILKTIPLVERAAAIGRNSLPPQYFADIDKTEKEFLRARDKAMKKLLEERVREKTRSTPAY